MNKIVIIVCAFIIAAAMVISLTNLGVTEVSANNRSIGWGSYDFQHIHIFNGVEGHCATVEKWYENEGVGIEVKTTEYGNIFCSEGSYILFSTNDCPFCGGK
jgi:hypothetical protein